MGTNYDKELLIELKSEINDNITVHPNIDNFLKDIKINYPMGFSGIDWNKKKPLFFVDFDSEELLLEKIDDEFSNILNTFPELLNEKLIFIGDNLTELGYEVSFKDFIRLKKIFLSIPQHIYLWFPKIKKCINITFENELIYG
jgi:hypothetical protein